jgi:hypothetical protein
MIVFLEWVVVELLSRQQSLRGAHKTSLYRGAACFWDNQK